VDPAHRGRGREGGITSLLIDDIPANVFGCDNVLREMRRELQLVYFTPAETKEAEYIQTEHFGARFENRFSNFDLTAVTQRWLRDLLWDYLARLFRSPQGPRSSGPVDAARRACVELSAFLEITAPGGGHDPRSLTEDDMLRFVADQARRARENLPSLGIHRVKDKQPGIVTDNTKRVVFNNCRRILPAAERAQVVACPSTSGQSGLAIDTRRACSSSRMSRPRPTRRPHLRCSNSTPTTVSHGSADGG
jgi:hypothetical protein